MLRSGSPQLEKPESALLGATIVLETEMSEPGEEVSLLVALPMQRTPHLDVESAQDDELAPQPLPPSPQRSEVDPAVLACEPVSEVKQLAVASSEA